MGMSALLRLAAGLRRLAGELLVGTRLGRIGVWLGLARLRVWGLVWRRPLFRG